MGGVNYVDHLMKNVHEGLKLPLALGETYDVAYVNGDYMYYHYGCDGFDDRGWGCGYRTLMMLCSWMRCQLKGTGISEESLPPIPSCYHVQQTLTEIGDKESDFINSRSWIGSVEVCLILDTLYNIPSKIIHIRDGQDLEKCSEILLKHFKSQGSPVMMGGSTDTSSKGIVGVCHDGSEEYLLIVDPHFWGKVSDVKYLHDNNWVKWQPISDFSASSFYNLCLPQLTSNWTVYIKA